jgi:hypothetical protein
MGATFGINDELAAQVVRYLLPPIVKSITRQTESSSGLLQFLEFLGARRFDRYMEDPIIFGHPQVASQGRAILAALFPRQPQIRTIIANRAKVLPVTPELLEMIFPYVAVLALGAIEQKTRQPLGGILQQLAKERLDPQGLNNPYVALARELRRRKLAVGARSGSKRAGALSGVFGALFARGESRPAA